MQQNYLVIEFTLTCKTNSFEYSCSLYSDFKHPWVNAETILQKCFIGYLIPDDPNMGEQELNKSEI